MGEAHVHDVAGVNVVVKSLLYQILGLVPRQV